MYSPIKVEYLDHTTPVSSHKIEFKSDESRRQFEALFENTANDYLKRYVGLKEFKRLDQILTGKMNAALPKFKDCKFCLGESTDKADKKCLTYTMQMNSTYLLAAGEFVKIVEANKNLFTSEQSIKELVYHFFDCLQFENGKGVLWFDFHNWMRYFLTKGFLRLSEIFSKMSTVTALSATNQNFNRMSSIGRTMRMYNSAGADYIEWQKEFFRDKKDYFLTQLEIEKAQNSAPKKSNSTRPNRTDLAFFAHYIDTAKIDYFEAHFPSLKAWDQLGNEFDKSAKNIQTKYNEIRKQDDRVLAKYVGNIEYVINSMLTPYPKAKSIANDELKLAKLK